MLRTKSQRIEIRSDALPSKDYFAKPRIYFKGDGIFRFGSNYLKDNFVKGALRSAGLPDDTKTVWSRKAGCKCGCTPGFILQIDWLPASEMVRAFGRAKTSGKPFDILVEIEQ